MLPIPLSVSTLLCLAWGASLVALVFASDVGSCKKSYLAQVSHHGKLSERKSPKVNANANATTSSSSLDKLLRTLSCPAAYAWTFFYFFAVVYNAGLLFWRATHGEIEIDGEMATTDADGISNTSSTSVWWEARTLILLQVRVICVRNSVSYGNLRLAFICR